MIKRYLFFSGDIYYPRGGWSDFKGNFDTVAEIIANNPSTYKYGWGQIVDWNRLLDHAIVKHHFGKGWLDGEPD